MVYEDQVERKYHEKHFTKNLQMFGCIYICKQFFVMKENEMKSFLISNPTSIELSK